MDIYLPENDSSVARPTIVFFHGGAFFFDNKESPSIVKWCESFASRGYVAVSVNYRLELRLGKMKMMEVENNAISDAMAAILFLKEKREVYSIDIENLFLAGTSAGAMIALQIPFVCQQCGCTVRAVANMWGAMPDTSRILRNYPPVISFHGGSDTTVPADYNYSFYNKRMVGLLSKWLTNKKYGSIPIHQKLNELKIRNQFYYFPSLKHKLHWDKRHKKENEYFYFIDDKITSFFLESMKVDDCH